MNSIRGTFKFKSQICKQSPNAKWTWEFKNVKLFKKNEYIKCKNVFTLLTGNVLGKKNKFDSLAKKHIRNALISEILDKEDLSTWK